MSRNVLKKITSFILSALLIVSCNNQLKNRIIAESVLGKITFEQFENSMLEEKFSNDLNKASESSYEVRREFLKEMLYRDIIFDLAEKNKIDTIGQVRDEYNKKLYSISIMNGLVEDSIRMKVYSEEDIKRTYEEKKMKYFPKHILIDSKKHGEKKAKAKIDSIYNMIMAGEKFEELAKSYSDDIKTGVAGGELGWVFAYDMVKEFEDQVITMKKGEISKPFKSIYGFHVIFLADTKKNEDLKDYQTEKQLLMKDLDKKYSARFNELFLEMIEGLISKYDVRIDSVNIKMFLKTLQAYNKGSEGDPLDRFTNEEKKMVLSKFDERTIDVNNVLSVLKMYPKDKRPVLKGYNDIKMYVIEKFRNELLERYADDLGYTGNPEYIKLARKMMYPTYKEKIINMEVRSKIPDPSNNELEAFYEKNKDDLFKEQDGTYKEFIKVKVSITNSIKGKLFSQALSDWQDRILRDYKVSIDHVLTEETFKIDQDDKK